MAVNKKAADPVRARVVEILGLVESGRFTAEDAIHQAAAAGDFTPLDIRFMRQLVNGITKLKRRLDHDIRFFLSKPSERLPRRLTDIFRLGFYQLFFTDRIPEAAVVSESVNLAHHFCDTARARLVNAVLRNAIRHPERIVFRNKDDDPVVYLADFYSYPEWFASYCLDEFGMDDTEKMLKAMNEPPRISFRVNLLKAKAVEIEEVFRKNEVPFTKGKYLPDFYHLDQHGLPFEEELINKGKIYIQDESAGMPVRLLNPKMGMNILDLAAAPGGKSAYAAVRMRNRGMITAVDRSHPRLKLMVENCRRLGVKIINPVLADILEFRGKTFDRVILDVPCTGWGNAGKHSDLRWLKTPDDVKRLSQLQGQMLDKAAKFVKPGGVLVYSTCTIIRKENDDVVEEFLIRNDDFILESGAEYFRDDIVSERGFVKTYPGTANLSGAFAARLKRKLKPKK